MSQHSEAPGHRPGLAAAWSVLIGMGGTSVTFNVCHAVGHGQLALALALLYGIAPVFAAAFLSHIAAVHHGGWFMRSVTFAVMLGAMSLSIGATASVVAPAAGALRWLFGCVLDAAALVALRVILDRRESDAAEATALEDAQQQAGDAQERAAIAESAAAQLTAELASARAELATAEAVAAAARNTARGSARKPARKRGAGSARKPAAASAASSAPEPDGEADDLTTEAQALKILAESPGISGSQLGLRLGKSDRYGRDLIRRLAVVAPDQDG